MSKPLRTLILEDHPADAELAVAELRRAGFDPTWDRVETEADFQAALCPDLDVVIADYSLPQFDALRALELMQEQGLDVPCIVVTGAIGEELAAECLKRGAADYLLKDRLVRLGPAVVNAIEARGAERALRDSLAEVDRRAREQAVLAEIGRIISSSLDIDQVYERFAEQVRSLIPFDRTTIILVDHGHDVLIDAYQQGIGVPHREVGAMTRLAGSQTEEVVRARSSLLVQTEERGELEGAYPGLLPVFDAGIRSFLAAPLISGGRAIGVLQLQSTTPMAYTQREVALAERVADQIAGAIANAKLHTDLDREAHEREVLAEIGRIISSSLDIGEVYERFGMEARKLIGADRIIVTLLEPGGRACVNTHMVGFEVRGHRRGGVFALEGSPTEAVCRTRSGLVFQPATVEEVVQQIPGLADSFRAGVKSFLAVPLISNDEVIGGLHMHSLKPDAYTNDDLELTMKVGAQIAGAIANARLHSELQREAREREALANIAHIMGSSLDIDEVYGPFVQEMRKLVPFDRIAIWTGDPDHRKFTNVYFAGAEIPGWSTTAPPFACTAAEGVMRNQTGLLVDEANLEELTLRFSDVEAGRDVGLRSMIMAPLISNHVSIGVLSLRSANPNAYTSWDLDLVERVGWQIAGAVFNAQLYAERKRAEETLRRSEEETRQLAHENSVLAEIGRIISSSPDIDEVYQRFTELVDTLIPFDRTTIILVDHEHDGAANAYHQGVGAPSLPIGTMYPLAGTQTEGAVHTRSSVLVQTDNRKELEDLYPGLLPVFDSGVRSFLVAPLESKGRPIGVFQLQSAKSTAYTPRDVALAERVAAQIAGAIVNAKLYAELEREAHERETLAEISRIMSSSLDLREVYERFSELAGALIVSDRLSISIVDTESTNDMVTVWSTGVKLFKEEDRGIAQVRFRVPIPGTLAGEVAHTGSGVVVNAASRKELVERFPGLGTIYDVGFRSFLAVPLISKDSVVGVLRFASVSNTYVERDLDMANLIGGQIAGAIANAQLYADQQAAQQRAIALRDIVEMSLGDVPRDELLVAMLDRLVLEEGASGGSIFLVDGQQQELVPVAMRKPAGLSWQSEERAMDRGFTRQVLEDGAPLIIRDVPNNPLVANRSARESGLQTIHAIPLTASEGVIGVASLYYLEDRDVPPEQMTTVEAMAHRMAEVIERARLIEELTRANRKLEAELAERLRAEEALGETEKKYRTVVENANDSIVVLQNGEAVFRNSTYEQLLGYTVEESQGQTFLDNVAAEDRERVRDYYEKRLDGQEAPDQYEVDLITRDGSRVSMEVRPQIIDYQGDQATLVVMRDITERQQLERQLLQAQKLEAVGQMAGGIAHDFNNVLTAVLSYSQLGQMALPQGERVHKYLREIEHAGERAAHLTRQLLTFSRHQIIEPRVLNLNEVILDVERMLRRLISADIELVTLFDSDEPYIQADPGQIEQVIMNLAVNARDAMPNGGKLIVETRTATLDEAYARLHADVSPGEYVVLSVADSGDGMTEATKARVFEPFFTTKEVGKGTGLGLSTCHGIVKQSGGHITLDSAPGRGSTFKIFLPRVHQDVDAKTLHDDSGYLPVGNETLMLVEDEVTVREAVCHILREQGYTVIEATNGLEALRIAEDYEIDEIQLLITDIVMPLMGGIELVEQFRAGCPDVKVLFVSGYIDDTVIGRVILQEQAEYMQKPFTPAVLARKVREILDQ